MLNPLPEYPEIVLALNLSSVRPPTFHWILWVPNTGATRERASPGTKMHAVCRLSPNRDGGFIERWSYEFTEFTLGTSHTVAAAAVLGHLPPGKTAEDLNRILGEIPMNVPAVDAAREREFTCRVWIREAVRRMHAHGYIRCSNVDALEEEMWRYVREAASKHDN